MKIKIIKTAFGSDQSTDSTRQLKCEEMSIPVSGKMMYTKKEIETFKKYQTAKIWIVTKTFFLYLAAIVFGAVFGNIILSGTLALIASVKTAWREESDFWTAWLEIMMCVRNKMDNPAHTNYTNYTNHTNYTSNTN